MKKKLKNFRIVITVLFFILFNPHLGSAQHEIEFNGWALQSNFSLPLVRYNFPHTGSDGTLEYFNAAGGGVGFSWKDKY
jgi:hypothetical protein